jgi:NAD(P)H-dependent flavin oxidoreductase YrpB (nitropropane dioxygenase family)
MSSELCERLGIEFPLFAFSHCRDVVVEVSRAGGLGMLGVAGFSPEKLESELAWIDEHVDGKPYGVDLIVPARFATKGKRADAGSAVAAVPAQARQFVRDLLTRHDIDPGFLTDETLARGTRLGKNMADDGALSSLDVAFAHPIALVANALGPPPDYMIERAQREDVPVAALVGTVDHAVRQAKAGVDIIVAAGGEAGGHCGDISTLVLVPEVVAAMAEFDNLPVLAAGGIVTGRQMAGCMAMGAAGAWCGSVWLTTPESEALPTVKEKMLAATSRDTVRSRARTGKYSRQLRSDWTDAWEAEGAPEPLPMPLQSVLIEPAMRHVGKLAEGGHEGAQALVSYFVGQGVGLMNSPQSTRHVVQGFMEDFVEASERLQSFLDRK